MADGEVGEGDTREARTPLCAAKKHNEEKGELLQAALTVEQREKPHWEEFV
jgi:hypothetical protein